MQNADISVIGSYGKDEAENRAFLYYSQFFKDKGANVPRIYVAKNNLFYLQEDLGSETLMHRNQASPREGDHFPSHLLEWYQKTNTVVIFGSFYQKKNKENKSNEQQ